MCIYTYVNIYICRCIYLYIYAKNFCCIVLYLNIIIIIKFGIRKSYHSTITLWDNVSLYIAIPSLSSSSLSISLLSSSLSISGSYGGAITPLLRIFINAKSIALSGEMINNSSSSSTYVRNSSSSSTRPHELNAKRKGEFMSLCGHKCAFVYMDEYLFNFTRIYICMHRYTYIYVYIYI
jgi:hypothetical protein